MADPTCDEERIHRKLIEIVLGDPPRVGSTTPPIATFPSRVYDANDRSEGSTAIVPHTVEANPLGSSFGQPERNRREYRLDRTSWTWELKIQFDQPVYTNLFEDALAANPVMLRADKSLGLRQVSFEIANAVLQHPPAHQARNGTKATYTIAVKLWPL